MTHVALGLVLLLLLFPFSEAAMSPSTANQIVTLANGLSPIWRDLLLFTAPFGGDVVTQAVLALYFAHRISNTVVKSTPCDAFAYACRDTIDYIRTNKTPVALVEVVHPRDWTRLRAACDEQHPSEPSLDDRMLLKHMTRLPTLSL